MASRSSDAVVVGGGHNGLVAANMLADAGWDVVVLEAEDEIGGAVKSAPITAPGFVNDRFSSFYPLAAGSPALAALDLESYGLRWAHAPAVAAHVLPDGRVATLSRDVAATAASVDAFAPGDGERWEAVYRDWQRISEPLLSTFLAPFPPVRGTAALLRRTGVADALRLARRFTLPARRYGDEAFDGLGARLLIAGMGLHTDLGPEQSASAGYGWLMAMLGQQFGFPVPEGGAGQLAMALANRLEKHGGTVVTSALVDRVVVGAGRALGARTLDGRFWRAKKAVLADVTAPVLYRHLVGAGHLPERLLADLDAFQWDFATVKVDWALSGRIPWTAGEAAPAGTVHLGGDLDALSQYAMDLNLGRIPADPFVLGGQMSTSDPTRSPEGTEAFWAYTHLPRGVSDAEATAHADLVQRLMERYAPGFGDLVLDRQVTTPDGLQRADASLVGGAINGGTSAIHQQLVFRPVPGLGRADTPIDKLFLASSSAHPGGGVHGAAGANAARAALARSRPVLGDVYSSGIGALNRLIYPQGTQRDG